MNGALKIIFFFLLIIFASIDVSAQSKPKRDTSKDNVGVRTRTTTQKRRIIKDTTTQPTVSVKQEVVSKPTEPKKQEEAVKSEPKKQEVVVKPETKKQEVAAKPIKTDVTTKPAVRTETKVVKKPTPTTPKEEKVRSMKAKVEPVTTPVPVRTTASISGVQMLLNQTINASNEDCLEIRANVQLKDAKGVKCFVIAKIFNDDTFGVSAVKASDGYPNNTFSGSGDVYTACEMTPTSNNELMYNIKLVLPNDAMLLTKKEQNMYCQLTVYNAQTSQEIYTYPVSIKFTAKNKKGSVTTKERK